MKNPGQNAPISPIRASLSGTAALEEGPEPTSGGGAVPISLIAMLALLLYAAGAHLNDRGGEFDPTVYYPFANVNDVADAHPKDPAGKARALGKQIYGGVGCVSCHQVTGEGQAGQFPPLAGSEWVLAEGPNRVIRIVLNGLSGPIDVRGGQFNSNAMMPWKDVLDDEKIAAAVTYIRSEWGNKAPPVTAAQVKKVRDQEKDRQLQWTADELKKIAEKD